ncbi:MAG TPA: alcohol dehydrogenase [Afipia sp.]|uniref:zinc-dependent alcohol dehydrogenase family protein n=1 Tax=unclassified Afipia TaxID=2642050 RepID=UPI000463A619|nr:MULTISPECIES: zinc-dependent alcohol dehydrogenase family protein [unclassified Afipia]MAH69044.1 alcohol dehydrogenase [Afipia sp.]OUX61806.1 MAG: alcohol dehydrogenase [Afipia sp. TMED4]HAO43693.1 alcohol dehydrogenase [Afipia sp.]HAP12547.1 alcohol dehydrogenase [Afipia sp.]HBF57241.1 alcohol dehydrogenase [Afipia sp.]
MHNVQINAFGKPWEVVETVSLPDPGAPGAGEIVVDMEFSPINPSDLVLMRGMYGVKPNLPAPVGAEGVARVAKIGSGVTGIKEGDRVLFPRGASTWLTRAKVKADGLFALPANADPQQLSMLMVNPPTAYLMLTEYVALKKGDWVIQSAGNSAVGRAVIAITKKMGIHTVSVVRRPELIEELKKLGADVVLVEGPDLAKRVREATDKAKIMLALDSVGGPGLMPLNDCLANGGTLVAYGVMSGGPGPFFTAPNIFRDLTLKGFWLLNWFNKNSPERALEVQKQVASWIADGTIYTPVEATYPLTESKAAISHAAKGAGKILFKGG